MKTRKWKPVYGETYYSILMDIYPFVAKDTWDDTETDLAYFRNNNCYKTRTEALVKMRLMKQILNKP